MRAVDGWKIRLNTSCWPVLLPGSVAVTERRVRSESVSFTIEIRAGLRHDPMLFAGTVKLSSYAKNCRTVRPGEFSYSVQQHQKCNQSHPAGGAAIQQAGELKILPRGIFAKRFIGIRRIQTSAQCILAHRLQ